MRSRDLVRLYFIGQGIGAPLFWAAVATTPALRRLLLGTPALEPWVVAHILPDLAFVGAGSLAVAWAAARRRMLPALLAWVVVGATGYAALFTFARVAFTNGPVLPAFLMLALTAGSFMGAERLAREARSSPVMRAPSREGLAATE